MKPLIIGVSGLAGSGKDEAADRILLELKRANLHAEKLSLAAPIKDICSRLFNMTDDDMNTQEGKARLSAMYSHKELLNRTILQVVGTECFRDNFGEDVWIDVLCKDAEVMGLDVVVIPDVRFENEAVFSKKHGILLKILASYPDYKGIATDSESKHASEAGYDQVPDMVIKNEGTLEEYHAKVDYFAQCLITPLAAISIAEAGNLRRQTFQHGMNSAKEGMMDALGAEKDS